MNSSEIATGRYWVYSTTKHGGAVPESAEYFDEVGDAAERAKALALSDGERAEVRDEQTERVLFEAKSAADWRWL